MTTPEDVRMTGKQCIVTIVLDARGAYVVSAVFMVGDKSYGGSLIKSFDAEAKAAAFQYAHDLLTEAYERDII